MTPLNPASLPAPFGRYSHGVEVPAKGRLVKTSGQLALASDLSIPESAFEQAQLIFQYLDAILQEGNMSRQDVIHLAAYVTDRAYMKEYMQARDLYFGELTPPASTLIIVSGFTREEFKVEIELLAMAD
ncbi:RidA family protein [Alteromonas aestuariivivens]|uniref:RidA family protein n=1 Tax=Alteromonas aestuariivivens TaxID=1938339 RepID=A0A3D8MF61_9ALTE|nr:RidA family protein [Alteromonas aestuariivivens]RDV29240.1 RidA family protein [Alteromonas aestuariivivens]